ncbi:hypothetical protein JK628_06105 [Shewanella sp. KX20019]|uniref:hypothetical protein n=1 Tax=Shewanella sp. KX20019 TaxID=2803864 RepID=UPI001925D0B2|nr:hypothetical protein [Shewanella sp. KX20019]QQX81433.1 hypothetical protein JK628_06105 [Shewanella sp. KX20019]
MIEIIYRKISSKVKLESQAYKADHSQYQSYLKMQDSGGWGYKWQAKDVDSALHLTEEELQLFSIELPQMNTGKAVK